MDRIGTIYYAIDEMFRAHGQPKPKQFGGGIWNYKEELNIWKKQVIEGELRANIKPLTPLQWKIINKYIEQKEKEVNENEE